MNNISVCVYITNRSHLFKYNLEGLARQNYDLSKVEVCVLDEGSTDNLLSFIDRYSEDFVFKYAQLDRTKSYIPCINPAAGLNVLLRYMPSNDLIIKTDPEVVPKDPWLLSEISDNLDKDRARMYNSRCHFTEPDGWWSNYEDIVSQYQKHYHFAEGGYPFSRSRFYFFSGFSQQKFIELGGIEEFMCYGKGFDDTLLREMWKNRYGQYEKEITGETIHLFHGHPQFRPTLEIANGRIFNRLKKLDKANKFRLSADGTKLVALNEAQWANPKMLSKIYTIQNGSITNTEDINNGESKSLDLPF